MGKTGAVVGDEQRSSSKEEKNKKAAVNSTRHGVMMNQIRQRELEGEGSG